MGDEDTLKVEIWGVACRKWIPLVSQVESTKEEDDIVQFHENFCEI